MRVVFFRFPRNFAKEIGNAFPIFPAYEMHFLFTDAFASPILLPTDAMSFIPHTERIAGIFLPHSRAGTARDSRRRLGTWRGERLRHYSSAAYQLSEIGILFVPRNSL
jgi:hypothetical protein